MRDADDGHRLPEFSHIGYRLDVDSAVDSGLKVSNIASCPEDRWHIETSLLVVFVLLGLVFWVMSYSETSELVPLV